MESNQVEDRANLEKLELHHPDVWVRYGCYLLLEQWNTAGGYHILKRTGEIDGKMEYLDECVKQEFKDDFRDKTPQRSN